MTYFDFTSKKIPGTYKTSKYNKISSDEIYGATIYHDSERR